jgi:prefoldin subunit 5
MKKFLSVCMCFFILTISIITYMPVFSYAADNDFTLSITYDTAVSNSPSLSASEAHDAVMNHGDIYGSDHRLLFQYSPTSTYNWVFSDSKTGIKMSDVQLEKFLQCSNALTHLARLYTANASNNTLVRTMMGAVGVIANGDSELLTNFYDELTGNVNYLNAIQYDPSTGDLTFLADQVTALRNELKDIYYDSLGLFILRSEGTPQSLLSSAKYLYEHEEDFQSDYVDIQNRDYVFSCMAYNGLRMVVRYVFSDTPSYFYWNGKDSYCEGSNLVVMNSNFDILTMDYVSYYSSCEPKNISFRNNVPLHKSDLIINNGSYFSGLVHYYSDTNEPIKIWSSYEALYNYLHGSQNAYLSSKVEEAGEDIKLSINDLNENIGSKMDELIDSINNKKDGMSADELQKAIDNALNSISGKIDDIGDNTQQTNNKLDALLESVSGTNQILMQILGVTTDIRDIVKTKDDEGNKYTMSDVKNCFNTMFNNLKYSILYGKNVTNKPDAANVSTAAYVSYSDVSTSADTSAETLDYKDGLLGKFPFSVPYQMYEWLQVLQVDEKVPQFTYNYGFLIGQKGKQEYDLTFDLTQYQPWADVLKSFLRLSFTLIMSVFIYNKFKGEM